MTETAPFRALQARWLAPALTILALGVAVAALLGARSYLAARDARVQLAATLAAQNTLIDQAAAREHQRAAELAATLAQIEDLKRRAETPQQVVGELRRYLPALPQPIELKLPEPQPGQPQQPATAIIPAPDLKPLFDALQDCRACQSEVRAAQGDLADERAKIAALTAERDAAVRAAKGGSFWSRVRRGAKWFAIGAAAGAIAAAAHR